MAKREGENQERIVLWYWSVPRAVDGLADSPKKHLRMFGVSKECANTTVRDT